MYQTIIGADAKVVKEGAHRKKHSSKHRAEHLWENGRKLQITGYSPTGLIMGRLYNHNGKLQKSIVYFGEDEIELINDRD